MCAINGIFGVDRELVDRMNRETKHRGPDGSGIYCNNYVTLGHNRLAIIDTSDRAAQPMQSNDGTVVISFNGEIYNFGELKAILSAEYLFKTESDTEVLVAAYQKWGIEMLAKLRGMFAFAIWDNKEKALYLVRDQMGVKPLYYTFASQRLIFSSEIAGVIAASKSRHLDAAATFLYLKINYAPSPRTIVSGIEKLGPGEYMKITKQGKHHRHQYYNPSRGLGIGVTKPNVYDSIDDVVKGQLVSDRPLGVFLSGGLDSSIILHHAVQNIPKIRTFSIDFEMVKGGEAEAGKFNADARLAEKTADIYGAEHTTFTLTLDDIRNNLISIFEEIDEPIANPTSVSLYLLAKKTREAGVVVALSGSGGDELFGGYTRHRALMAAYWYQHLPVLARRALVHLGGRFVKLNTPFPDEIHHNIVALKDRLVERTLKPEKKGMADSVTKTYFKELYANTDRQPHPVQRFLLADRSSWLPDESLLREDHTSMRHGLELRVPFLDIDVVATADSIPMNKKTTPLLGKKILREIYRPHLPDFLFNQPKRGFLSPGAKWMRDETIKKTMKEVLSSSYYNGLDTIFDWDAIQEMYEEHLMHNCYNLYPLWSIAQLQVWARKNNLTL